MAPSVVYHGIVAAEQTSEGGLFTGLKFCLSKTVPQFSRFAQDIVANGGQTFALEEDADILLYDHARKHPPPGAISYRFVERSVRNGKLEDIQDHRIGCVQSRSERMVGSTATAPKVSRKAFTLEEDRWLWNQMRPYKGLAGEKGNGFFKELERINPNHTYQSWRDRWIKRVSNNAWDEISDTSEQPLPISRTQQPAPAAKRKREETTAGDKQGEDRDLRIPPSKKRELLSEGRAVIVKQNGHIPAISDPKSRAEKLAEPTLNGHSNGIQVQKTSETALGSDSEDTQLRNSPIAKSDKLQNQTPAIEAPQSAKSDSILPKEVSYEDFGDLLTAAPTIVYVDEDDLTPWIAFAKDRPDHSAAEWREFFYRFVRPRYFQNLEDVTMEEAESEQEENEPDDRRQDQRQGLETGHESEGKIADTVVPDSTELLDVPDSTELLDDQNSDQPDDRLVQGAVDTDPTREALANAAKTDLQLPPLIPKTQKKSAQLEPVESLFSRQSSWNSHSTGGTIMPNAEPMLDVGNMLKPIRTPEKRRKMADSEVLNQEIPETPSPESDSGSAASSPTPTKRPLRSGVKPGVIESQEEEPMLEQAQPVLMHSSPNPKRGRPRKYPSPQEKPGKKPETKLEKRPSDKPGRKRERPPKVKRGRPPNQKPEEPSPGRKRGRPRTKFLTTSPLHVNLFETGPTELSMAGEVFASSPPNTDGRQEEEPPASPTVHFETAPDFTNMFQGNDEIDSDYVDESDDLAVDSESDSPLDSYEPTRSEDAERKGKRRQVREEHDSLKEELNIAAQQERYLELSRISEVGEEEAEGQETEERVPETNPSALYETAREYRPLSSQSPIPSPLPTQEKKKFLGNKGKTSSKSHSDSESLAVSETSESIRSNRPSRLVKPNRSFQKTGTKKARARAPPTKRRSPFFSVPGSPELGSSVPHPQSPPTFVPGSPDLGSGIPRFDSPARLVPGSPDLGSGAQRLPPSRPSPQAENQATLLPSVIPISSESDPGSDSDNSTTSTESSLDATAFLASCDARGWDGDVVSRVLAASTGHQHRAAAAYPLVMENGGKLLESRRGLWTEADDAELNDGDKEGKMRKKHGRFAVSERKWHLEMLEEE